MNREPAQLPLFADILPDGRGGFNVKPRKPAVEVNTVQAARILGVSRAQMWYLRNCHPIAQQILRWRWTSHHKRKILWETSSLMAYREALSALD